MAWLLGLNKNTVQRIFQIKSGQVRMRPIGMRPRIEAVPSMATAPNERWSTDLCRLCSGHDGWSTLALVIDGHTRELLGWHLSRSGKAATAATAVGVFVAGRQDFIMPNEMTGEQLTAVAPGGLVLFGLCGRFCLIDYRLTNRFIFFEVQVTLIQ